MIQATALLTVTKTVEEDLLDMVIWAPVVCTPLTYAASHLCTLLCT